MDAEILPTDAPLHRVEVTGCVESTERTWDAEDAVFFQTPFGAFYGMAPERVSCDVRIAEFGETIKNLPCAGMQLRVNDRVRVTIERISP